MSSCPCMEYMEAQPCYNVSTPVLSRSIVLNGTKMGKSFTGNGALSSVFVTPFDTMCCSYLPGKPDPITIHDVEGITLDVSVMSHNCPHQSSNTRARKYL